MLRKSQVSDFIIIIIIIIYFTFSKINSKWNDF